MTGYYVHISGVMGREAGQVRVKSYYYKDDYVGFIGLGYDISN